jgi:probable HAF family extracellular repeat protein
MAAFGLLVMSSAVKAQTKYTVTDLGGGTSLTAINNHGEIAGSFYIGNNLDNPQHAFLYKNGKMIDLGTLPGYDTSVSTAINNLGEVVGLSYNANNTVTGSPTHAFLYNGTKLIDLGTGGQVLGINDSGEMTGYWNNKSTTAIAFRYMGGKIFDIATIAIAKGGGVGAGVNDAGQVIGTGLPSPEYGFLYSNGRFQNLGDFQPLSINAHGQMAGSEPPYGLGRACLYSGGHLTALGLLPGQVRNKAYSINDAGEIIGISYGPDASMETLFIYRGGQVYNLQEFLVTPGWTLVNLGQINNAGQITGIATYIADRPSHGVLLTPVR